MTFLKQVASFVFKLILMSLRVGVYKEFEEVYVI